MEYFKIENSVTPGEVNTLNTTIEIEAGESKTVPAYLRIYRKEADGSETNFLQESQNTNNIVITVDNSESYAPKSGADFLLNPKFVITLRAILHRYLTHVRIMLS